MLKTLRLKEKVATRTALALVSLVVLLFTSCAGKSVKKFNNQVDRQITSGWQKTISTVRNPEYMSLMQRLKKAHALFAAENYEDSYKVFRAILVNKSFRHYREYDDAKFYMANCLYQLGMYYGALTYFIDILRGETEKIYKEESLEKSLEIAQRYRDNELILYLTSVLPSEILSPEMKESLRYFIAKDLYNKNEFERAWDVFSSVGRNNKLYLAARYHLGVIALRAASFNVASRLFEEIIRINDPNEYYNGQEISQLAILAQARILYEFGRFDRALKYYERIDKNSDNYALGLYEVSWALYKKNDYANALATLHSLTGPFFDLTYFPKATLLKGVIYLDNCYYREALASLKKIRDHYQNLRYTLRRFYKLAARPENYYKLLVDDKISDFRFTKRGRFKNITKLVAINKDFMALHRHIMSLDQELFLLEKLDLGSGEKFLRSIINKKRKRLVRNINIVTGRRLKEVAGWIKDFINQADLVSYEIIRAERKILQEFAEGKKTKIEITEAQAKKARSSFELTGPDKLFWDFEGEYWEDEIGYYIYNIKSLCRRWQSRVGGEIDDDQYSRQHSL